MFKHVKQEQYQLKRNNVCKYNIVQDMSRKDKDMCIVQCMYIVQCVQTGEQVLKHV